MDPLVAFCLGIAAASLWWSWRLRRLIRHWEADQRAEQQARQSQAQWDARVKGFFR